MAGSAEYNRRVPCESTTHKNQRQARGLNGRQPAEEMDKHVTVETVTELRPRAPVGPRENPGRTHLGLLWETEEILLIKHHVDSLKVTGPQSAK
ncbi:hypothetical protein SKAU_G00179410 [Synaphobranchus kaupii]|uniref:Uncharacterized protein n=1 Tax=Synaphobranchus kaupii TaxID=118154 RepID=A0A9Q1FM36_SYNKA|nr:hypothetical protein SKAU_G00179410 [Synaphobranchus kaupii]